MSPILHIAASGAFMAALGVALASLLAFANRRLYVFEDPRIDQVDEMLPHANCGACGTAGCRQFAEALIDGRTDPGKCTVNSAETNQVIADLLGVAVGDHEKQVARLACGGGSHVARTRARYQGMKSCRAAALVSGGGKSCAWGCLGLADCAEVCDFDAITMDRHGLPLVDGDKCTACGDCVEVCPKGLFSLQPASHRLWVACKNRQLGDEAELECQVACTACGRCVVDAPEGLISLQNNLAVIDYGNNRLASRIAIERCPTGAIAWLDNKGAQKGRDSKKVVRQEALPVG